MANRPQKAEYQVQQNLIASILYTVRRVSVTKTILRFKTEPSIKVEPSIKIEPSIKADLKNRRKGKGRSSRGSKEGGGYYHLRSRKLTYY